MMKSKKILSLILALMLTAAVAFSACSATGTSSAPVSSGQQLTSTELGEGKTTFNLQVVESDGKQTDFVIHTDEKTVGAALLKLDLIAGEESEYGLYVKTVNGVTADFDKDKTYWAFYIDGEYAMTGVDSTDITAGATYALKIEK